MNRSQRLTPPAAVALGLLVAVASMPSGADGSRAVVAAATPEAAEAGAEVLRAGGNAIDAAVAVAFALGVSEPAGSGLGGQIILLIAPPGARPFVVNGASRAPRATSRDATSEDLVGWRATTVPTEVRVLDFVWREYGSGRLGWAELLAPAIRIAEEGYVPGPFRRAVLMRHARKLRENPTAAAELLVDGGDVPPVGHRMTRPRLARTLRRLATAGALDFYRGEIAAQIATDIASHGGWVSARDLAEQPEPEVQPPLEGRYREWTIHTLPPPAGGWVVIQALNVLEHADPAALTIGGGRRTAWVAEALRFAHAQRAERPVGVPGDYERAVARRIDKNVARGALDGLDLPGRGETTHFVVVDGDGQVVSATASLNSSFGAGVMSAELGFLYNDYMREFDLTHPNHPFALRPGAHPYSSMSATILARDGRPQLALGSPGSRRIISAVVQVVSAWADAGLTLENAVAAPRVHAIPETDELLVERRPALPTQVGDLEARGFSLSLPINSLVRHGLNPYFGGVQAAALGGDGTWTGAADPRRDGGVRYVATSEVEGRDADSGDAGPRVERVPVP
jgi:gamma-glutamyltranspeptidase/glutathione hydrolase